MYQAVVKLRGTKENVVLFLYLGVFFSLSAYSGLIFTITKFSVKTNMEFELKSINKKNVFKYKMG